MEGIVPVQDRMYNTVIRVCSVHAVFSQQPECLEGFCFGTNGLAILGDPR